MNVCDVRYVSLATLMRQPNAMANRADRRRRSSRESRNADDGEQPARRTVARRPYRRPEAFVPNWSVRAEHFPARPLALASADNRRHRGRSSARPCLRGAGVRGRFADGAWLSFVHGAHELWQVPPVLPSEAHLMRGRLEPAIPFEVETIGDKLDALICLTAFNGGVIGAAGCVAAFIAGDLELGIVAAAGAAFCAWTWNARLITGAVS
jgi:hypothetical protein